MSPSVVENTTTSRAVPAGSAGSVGAARCAAASQASQLRAQERAMKPGFLSHSPDAAQAPQPLSLSWQAARPHTSGG